MSYPLHPKYSPVSNDEYGPHLGCDALENSSPRQTSIFRENASYTTSSQPALEFYDTFDSTQTISCVPYGALKNDSSFKPERLNSTSSTETANTALSSRCQETNSAFSLRGRTSSISPMFYPISNPTSYQAEHFFLDPMEDSRGAEHSWVLPTGSGQVGAFPSNVLLPDMYEQPEHTPAADPLFGSNLQNIFNDSYFMDNGDVGMRYLSQSTLCQPNSLLIDPFPALPPSLDPNSRYTSPETCPRASPFGVVDDLLSLAAVEISHNVGRQTDNTTFVPPAELPPISSHHDVSLDDIFSLQALPVQRQQAVSFPHSAGSQLDVAGCSDLFIEPNAPVSVVDEPPPVAHSSEVGYQDWFTKGDNHTQHIRLDDARVISLDTPTFSQITFGLAGAQLLSVRPPPADLTRYPMKQRELLVKAFTKDSFHPSVALRGLLDYVLPSAFISDQVLEPFLADRHSIQILERIICLPQCPPVDFGNSKRSLFTLFVDNASPRCLFCGLSKRSLPQVLGCVRSHLNHKPFKCAGCPLCNPVNGHAQFWTLALLKDHQNGQTKKKECPECGSELRRGGMLRHWKSMHKQLPFPFHGNPRYRRSIMAPNQASTSASIHLDDIAEQLMDCESD